MTPESERKNWVQLWLFYGVQSMGKDQAAGQQELSSNNSYMTPESERKKLGRPMFILWDPRNGEISKCEPARTFIDQLMYDTRIRNKEHGRTIIILWDPNYGKSSRGRSGRTFIDQLIDDLGIRKELLVSVIVI